MRLYRTDAIVLRDREFGEADRLVTLFSREMGKLRGIAKGSRRPKSRLLGGTQPFVYSRLMMYRGRSLDVIAQCQVIRSFNALQGDLVKVGCASCMAEIVDLMTREGEPIPLFFDVLREGLERLDTARSPEESLEALCSFELKALDAAGYRPSLHGCVLCSPIGSVRKASGDEDESHLYSPSPSPGDDYWFDISEGGLVCHRCIRRDHKLLRVSQSTLDAMRRLASWTATESSPPSVKGDTILDLQELIEGYVEYRLERAVRSFDFLRRIWKGG